jgi:hypothetical protein
VAIMPRFAVDDQAFDAQDGASRASYMDAAMSMGDWGEGESAHLHKEHRRRLT